jgi:DDE superfamily endonuclease/short chain dehydrogenase
MTEGPLKGQIALVTGAASGIGAGVARSLGSAGASVAINYVTNPEAAEAVAGEVQSLGGKALTLKADVSSEEQGRASEGRRLHGDDAEPVERGHRRQPDRNVSLRPRSHARDGAAGSPGRCLPGKRPIVDAPPRTSTARCVFRRSGTRISLLWDRGSIHRRREVRAFLAGRTRLHVHYFPAYAPELNPAEYVWAQADHNLANGLPDDLHELRDRLQDATRRLRRSQALLWSCVYASDLPWAR